MYPYGHRLYVEHPTPKQAAFRQFLWSLYGGVDRWPMVMAALVSSSPAAECGGETHQVYARMRAKGMTRLYNLGQGFKGWHLGSEMQAWHPDDEEIMTNAQRLLSDTYDLHTRKGSLQDACKVLHQVLAAAHSRHCWVYDLESTDPESGDFSSALLKCLLNSIEAEFDAGHAGDAPRESQARVGSLGAVARKQDIDMCKKRLQYTMLW
jgi:hypothetical protein